MEHKIDWEYYSSLFSSAKEDDFERLVTLAELKMDVWTHGRFNTDEEYKVKQVKFALASLVEALAVSDTIPNGVKSVSNDGYSESYATAEEVENQLKSIVFDCLSGTGLMGVL